MFRLARGKYVIPSEKFRCTAQVEVEISSVNGVGSCELVFVTSCVQRGCATGIAVRILGTALSTVGLTRNLCFLCFLRKLLATGSQPVIIIIC